MVGCLNVVWQDEVLIAPKEHTWEKDGMERNVVLAHELIKSYADAPPVRVLEPPASPLVSDSLFRYAEVTDRGIEPDVEHFFLVSRQGHGDTPGEISSDASRLQTFLQPGTRYAPGPCRPTFRRRHTAQETLALLLKLRKVQEELMRHAELRGGTVHTATRVEQLGCGLQDVVT